MNRWIVLTGCLLFLLSGTVHAKSPPPGTGKADVPANILFMVDTSGSMRARISGGTVRRPHDVAVDSKGFIYVVERESHRIKKLDSSGSLLTTFGSYGNGNKNFRYPWRIAIDADDMLYVSDTDNNRIQKFDTNFTWKKTFKLQRPRGIDVDSKGNVYAGSNSLREIHKWDKDGVFVAKWGSDANTGLSIWEGPDQHPKAHDDFLYAVDETRIRQYDVDVQGVAAANITDGALVRTFSNQVSTPLDVEVTDNGVYAVTQRRDRVVHYKHDGTYIRQWGGYGWSAHKFAYPRGLGSDSTGKIYIADYRQDAIKVWSGGGTFIETLGGAGSRLDEAKKVIKKLVSDSDLTKGAYFGLMDWNHRAVMKTNIDVNGAATIFTTVDRLRASGGTSLDPAMVLARNYMRGGNSPINKSASCQKTFLIVISDGSWWDNQASNIAKDLLKQNGIKTFVVGFHTSGNANYTKLAKAGGTHPDSPLFTNNWQHLYTTLAAYIRSAIASRLTFTTPFIMPSISADDHIYQSTFKYKKTHQWEGSLAKYKLKPDGTIGGQVWDAGKKLEQKSSNTRKIWTVSSHAGLGSGLNNFTTTNKKVLKELLWEDSGVVPTDTEVENLINFVRGVDAYDEDADNSTTDERWKLGDIYHSELTVVGPPIASTTDKATQSNTEAYYRDKYGYAAFKSKHANRKSVVYAGANDGMLHAFDAATGDELWAFIPPAMLPNLRNMISAKPNSSTSIYGVDGSPAVKDVYYGGKWRTMLVAGLGRGGHSYFALDVTNRTAPKFLWSFSNDPANKWAFHWNKRGSRTKYDYNSAPLPTSLDYSKLGEAWSTPVIVLSPSGGTMKWVAAFGAGFNAGINTNYGSAVYVIDLGKEGKVLKKISLTDSPGGYANAAHSALTAVTADTTSVADYKGAMVYVADLESKLWKINLTNNGSWGGVANLFDGGGTNTNGRSNFFSVTPSIGNDGKLWVYWGTGDQQKLQHMSGSIQNRIYGVRDKDFPKWVMRGGLGALKNTSGKGSICPGPKDNGWYIDLKSNEKVTGKIAIHNETLFVSRYTPNNTNICNPGTNLLSEHGYGCGKADKETSLGTGILTGAQIYKGQIYVGISGVPASSGGNPAAGFTQHGNIIIGKPANSSSTGGSVSTESWRELF